MKAKDKPGAEMETAVEKPSETATEEAAAKNADSGFTVSRVLMETSPAMSGKDVKALQKALIKTGYGCGKDGADGKFGHYTMLAIRALQGDRRLTVNGMVGQRTVEALGGGWKG